MKSSSTTPAVAVITRTRNRPLMLARALDSVSGQTFRDVSWIIVNDGGEPAAVESIAEQGRQRGLPTAVHHHPQSLGMEAASNVGIRASDSEFIVIHDDDDSWEPAFLDASVSFLREFPRYAGVVTQSTKVEEEVLPEIIRILARSPFNPDLLSIYLHEMAQENTFPPISFLYRRSVINTVGLYAEDLPVLGDWDFNLRFLENYDIGVIPKALANYHHRRSLTDAQSHYGNSLYAGQNRHIEYDAIVRNRLLRRDLALGKQGLGWLVATGRQHLTLRRLDNTVQRLVRLGSRFGLDRLLRRF
ncbi:MULTISPECIES: glycosyltransferase family A protein [Candidatus Accumulibacter]|uniref:Glycosyltransferase EpsH n=2 Tax=Candidatus Accumulibacter TaxID=327159 RepID=A0A080ML96_9PROT|nr:MULTISPECIES: glycosyltransferase family A protein [Candidatus Accumulibacter]KFB78419.1 MAG: putative glycosyltransferase EpsH [Candidatus Accumulibacter cognatus]MBL8401383.1 glycosyltransferase family 2 protein [Accumulibacter sp.]MCC2869400.1 glycosyltransferase family 2 protein [Candidatus Accumulibacter phosphatis]